MTASTAVAWLVRACDRFNAAHPWDHNAHYHRWILRQLPSRAGRALDVGCGSGDLVRALATRAERVHGIDRDATITDHARRLTPRAARIDYTAADALAHRPAQRYDVITCVAALHHLPFAPALTEFRRWLAPHGTLVVLGVYRENTTADRLLAGVAVPANLLVGWASGRGKRPVAMTAPTRPATMTFAEITQQARRILPGTRVRRHLFWRYSLVWTHHEPS
ncbi:class I SAM-dependent methyltransferase [Saccharopolyspora sp. K220]|uniref:class I SAM-dependent methyltransferase n=1 Tax=Saccharopolyspora soli TaxID=2926618 RepID=UPI001F588F65|nr:class I SAM-dependent methyltransferase [Saccharopolyspora soli]MCI2416553.1 class I SAM-dependent methyltransferase [Saccharopolyspora soli]